MKDYHKGHGFLQYDPYRGEMKHRTNWWCVINVDREITRYYRWWLSFEKHIHLQQPAWDAHISCVRGERPSPEYLDLWKKYQGERVEFLYKFNNIRVDRSQRTDERAKDAVGGLYYFIDILCPRLDEIRAELGLRTGFNYHLTVGRTYEFVARKPKR
ncbi:MAG: hypothetical protein ACXW2E_01375 [Nitrososphaeraceae archaeon]